jgi:tetratricopeptide (TPR) repeat protein
MTEHINQLIDQLAVLNEASPADETAIIALHKQLVEAYQSQNKFGKAAEHLEAAIALISEQADTELQQAELYHELAWLYSRILETERAITCSEKSLELFAEKEAEAEYAKVYRRLGALYVENGDTAAGMEHLEAGLEWAKQGNDPKIAGDIYQTIAEVYGYLQKYQDASNAYINAIRQYELAADYEQIAASRQAIGRILMQHGKHTQAIEQYEMATQNLLKQENSAENLGFNHVLIAKIYESKSNVSEAIKNYSIAAQHFAQSSNKFEHVNADIQVAALYEESKKWQNALETYQKILPYAEAVADEMQTATVTEGIKHCQKMIDKQKTKPQADNNTSDSGGIFGKIKKIFGG